MTCLSGEPERPVSEFALIDFSGHRHADRYACSTDGCDLEAHWLADGKPVCDPCATRLNGGEHVWLGEFAGEPVRLRRQEP